MAHETTILLTQAFQDFINASATGSRKPGSGKKLSLGVIGNYRHFYTLLNAFEAHSGTVYRIAIGRKFSTRRSQAEHRYWKRFFQRYSRYLYQRRRYTDNMVANCFKTIKAVFNYLRRDRGLSIGDYHHQFRVPVLQPMPVALLPEQLQFLISNDDFHRQLPAHLQRSRDIFVFGCTTGLRIGDLMRLHRSHLIKTAQGSYLQLHTQKTNAAVCIPLPDYCLAILQRYRKQKGGFLLPRLSVTNLNIQIKAIGLLAGWDHPLPKYRSQKGRLVEVKTKTGGCWKFYQHLTCHTMRRTAITTLLMLGVHEEVVRRISGHAPGSKEFYRYIMLAQSYLDTQVQAAHRQLAEGWSPPKQ